MKKYFAIIPAFAVAFAFTVAPAFASFYRYDSHRDYRSEDKIEVENWNNADVDNDVEADSNTGKNDANRNRNVGRIDTGRADALATADTTANSNETAINVRSYDRIEVKNRNEADVDNDVEADSNTGYNDANNNGSTPAPYLRTSRHHHMPVVQTNNGRGVINTGDAISTAQAVNMLNSNVTRIN